MNLTDANYFSMALGLVTQIATLAVLWWLYRCTGLKPVLYNLLWNVPSAVWGFAGGYLNRKLFVIQAGHEPSLNIYLFVASTIIRVVGTAFFIWMLVALARWYRGGPPLPASAVSPSPAA